MPKYRTKPQEVEAVHYTGDNLDEIKAFMGDNYNDTAKKILNVFKDCYVIQIQKSIWRYNSKGKFEQEYEKVED
jgi:hypothetical protein